MYNETNAVPRTIDAYDNQSRYCRLDCKARPGDPDEVLNTVVKQPTDALRRSSNPKLTARAPVRFSTGPELAE